MASFGNCVGWVLRLEDRRLSGVSKNLGDGAGFTRFGITSKNNPQVPINFFTATDDAPLMPNDEALEMAKHVYWDKYWVPICGSVLPTDELAATLLSFDVNDGREAVKLLQGCLGLTQDGSFGAATEAAVDAANPADLTEQLREAQEQFYRNVAARKPQDAKFLNGWITRARLIYPNLPA